MSDDSNTTRRRFLQGLGATGAAALAGCTGIQNPLTPQDDGETPEPREQPSPTPTEEPEKWILNGTDKIVIEWTKELENEIQNGDFSQFQVKSSEGRKADSFTLFEKNEGGEDTKILETDGSQAEKVSPTEFQGGENKLYAEVEKDGQRFQTENTHQFNKDTPGQYIADITLSEDTSQAEHSHSTQDQWSTPYSFDNHVFDQQRINDHREKWNEEAAWDGFTQQLQQEGKVLEAKYIDAEYPNAYKGEVEGKGYFDIDEFTSVTKKEGGFRELLEWLRPAVRMKDFHNEVSMNSGAANKMAASAEQAIDQLNPSAEARGWGVYNTVLDGGGHGTMMFYDEKWGTGWWHIDTTDPLIRKPENAQDHREDVWSPFRSKEADQPGFHPGPVRDGIPGYLTYEMKSTTGFGAITNMVTQALGHEEEHLNYNKAFITDPWLNTAYEEIREDVHISKILDPIEEMVDHQVETGEYAGIFGDTLEDAKLVAGPGLEDLYQEVMTHPEAVREEDVFNYLEGETSASAYSFEPQHIDFSQNQKVVA